MSDDRPSGEVSSFPLPVDLAAVLGIACVGLGLVTVSPVRSVTIGTVVGGLLVLFAPGYALVGALFPAGVDEWSPSEKRQLDTAERLALGAGLSLAVVGLLLLMLGLIGIPFEPAIVIGTVSGFTVVATAVAVIRRRRLPVAERYRVVAPGWSDRLRSRLGAVPSQPRDRTNILIIIVAMSLVIALAGVGTAMTQRGEGETFTEFALLTEGADGELVADGYPSDLTRGEPESLVVAIENHERQTESYDVVVVMASEDERRTLDSYSLGPVRTGERVTREIQITPTTIGDSVTLSFLLYRGSVPADPSAENAYRALHLRTNVTDPNA